MTNTTLFIVALLLTPLVAWLVSKLPEKEPEPFGKGKRGRDLLSPAELTQAREEAEDRFCQPDPPHAEGREPSP